MILSETSQTHASLNHLQKTIADYPDLPPEAIIKQDILRLGLNFDLEVFKSTSDYKPKDYFIFSFDLLSLAEMPKELANKAPEEIRLSGGPFGFRNTVVSVRVHLESPYCVMVHEGKPALSLDGQYLGDLEFHGVPKFYGEVISSGKKISEITPVLEWGYLLYLTVFRTCQYWGKDEECRFCDINENYRQQRKDGRQYTGVKSPEVIVEALGKVDEKDDVAKAYTLTGGSITKTLQGYDEVEFYLRYIEAIESRFPSRWIGKAVVQAFKQRDFQRLKDAGLKIIHPNYEVWDARLFEILCPGKARTIGRDEWIRRLYDAVEVFGVGKVIPNFVGGVEMSAPYGFTTVDEAIKSTSQGLDELMKRGVLPRFTTWCPEPLADLGKQNPPPLEYFCKLLLVWRETFEKYSFSAPEGYGPAGPGKAVFSVSAFMDVIDV